MTEPDVLTLVEAAALLRLGRTTVYGLARAGQLPGCRMIGGSYRVSRRALLAFLEAAAVHGSTPPPATTNPRPTRRRARARRSVASSRRAKHPHSPE
jgi:excisionase family DNA binding protein